MTDALAGLSPTSSLTAPSITSTAASATSATSSANTLGQNAFLKLLIAQLQNQDPLNPTDSTTFVSQLAQFSELEQVMAIRSDTDTMATDLSSSAAAGAAAGTAASANTPATTGQTTAANQTQS